MGIVRVGHVWGLYLIDFCIFVGEITRSGSGQPVILQEEKGGEIAEYIDSFMKGELNKSL